MKHPLHLSNCADITYWIEDKLYLNITNLCTNDCYFCLRKYKRGIKDFNLTLIEEPSLTYILEKVETALRKQPWSEIIFCGFGEPTTRLEILLKIVEFIRQRTKAPIRINTNGHAIQLYPKTNVINEIIKSGVNRISVSLNAHNKTTYEEVCRPKIKNPFQSVLEFIKSSKQSELDVELTAVSIPEIRVAKIKSIASKMGVRIRIRPYIPIIW